MPFVAIVTIPAMMISQRGPAHASASAGSRNGVVENMHG
jgi:hypothetical protein